MMSEEVTEKLGALYASQLAIMVEAKDQGDGSRTTLFKLESFREMIELENFIINLTSPTLSAQVIPERVTFYDLCRKVNATDEIIE